MCVQYMVLVYLGSVKVWVDMDVIWTELKAMCMQDHRRMSKGQTMCSESDHSCRCSQSVCGLEFCGKGEIVQI
jgi:hypothetical protein